jgi:hypothetical protein
MEPILLSLIVKRSRSIVAETVHFANPNEDLAHRGEGGRRRARLANLDAAT